jgi:hypothetical protein
MWTDFVDPDVLVTTMAGLVVKFPVAGSQVMTA